MKKLIVLSALMLGTVALGAIITWEGKLLTATTTPQRYLIGGDAASSATSVKVVVSTTDGLVFVMPNVTTNNFVLTNSVPVRYGEPYTFRGQIFSLCYAVTNSTVDFDISCEGQ